MTVLDVDPHPGDIDRALAALEWSLIGAEQVSLRAGSEHHDARGASGFVFVVGGRIRLVDSVSADRSAGAGDLVVLPRDGIRRLDASDDAVFVRASFAPVTRLRTVLESLPDAVIASGFAEKEPAMVMLIGCMTAGGVSRVGDRVICGRIATMIASVAIRSWMEQGSGASGWLARSTDPHIGRVLERLHADLDRPWTVEDLARIATMSRSAFAARFREVVGQSPATYLAAARVDAGMTLLADDGLTVSQVALRLGYESEDGFSRAFRRHTGSTPSSWRSQRVAVLPEPLAG